VRESNIIDNNGYAMHVTAADDNAAVIDAVNNWWGTIDSVTIESMVFHLADSFSCPTVDFIPFADGPFDILDNGTVVIEEDDPDILPSDFVLRPNYPNPFNASTRIGFSLNAAADVKLVVYNITGQKIALLAGGRYRAGNYSVQWDGRMLSGEDAPSGIYFYRLTAGEYSGCRKMLYLK